MPIPKLVVTAGLMLAQVAMGAAKRIQGPRLEDLSVTLADYGSPIPRFWGKRRLQGQVIWAEKLREKKTTSKTKGGKYTDYKYFGNWAVLICDHEIDSVARIWMDKHLVFDRTGSGPISVGAMFANRDNIKLSQGRNYRVYTGTETQDPDPRIETWCEDRYGPNTCPAYRGSAYIVFEEIPLEKFGNRIPQIAVEAIKQETSVYPVASIAQSGGTNTLQFTPDYMRLYGSVGGGEVRVIDVPTRTQILSFHSDGAGWFGIAPTNLYGLADGFPSHVTLVGFDGGDTVLPAGSLIDESFYAGGLACFRPYGGISPATYYFDGTDIVGTARSFIADHYFEDTDGNAWAVGQVPGQNKVGFVQMPDGAEHLVDTTDNAPAYAMCNEDGKFLTWQAGKLFIVDPDTWTAGTPVSASVSTSSEEALFRNAAPGAATIWLHSSEYQTSDASLIRTVNVSNWGSYPGGLLHDPVNHALINQSVSAMNWLFLDRINSAGVPLADFVADASEWARPTTQRKQERWVAL